MDMVVEYTRLKFNPNINDFVRKMISVIRKVGVKNKMKELQVDEDQFLRLCGITKFLQPIQYKLKMQAYIYE